MSSDDQLMSRRLLLSVAGFGLLSASACTPAFAGLGGSENAHPSAGAAPGSPTPSPSARASTPPAVNTPSPSLSPPGPTTQEVYDPLYQLSSSSSNKVVALTLDDGPHPVHTPVVLGILRKYGVRATFFIVGECAQEHPELVRQIAQDGHHLANHTWTHPELWGGLSATKVRDELERTSDILQKTSGKMPTWFRAPGGDWTTVSLRTCAQLGMRPMAWSVDPRDWSRPGTTKITTRVLDAIKPGSIVLNHDGGGNRSQTVAALETYLPVLIDEGYKFTAPR